MPNKTKYVKDGFHEYVVHGQKDKVNPDKTGTKVAAHFHKVVEPGQSYSVWYVAWGHCPLETAQERARKTGKAP